MPLVPGVRLGPYEIVALIGAGGMGEVYKARDTRLNRDVAIKVSAEQFSERFEREAQAIAVLNHSNICMLHDVGANYLVMEYIEGVPLKGPLPLDQALKFGAQICDALDAAHKKGITHRDLKPANILITRAGIKLLDFGLAQVGPASKPGEDVTRSIGLTQAGTILGTAAYMSPEQAEGKPVDARSDIFSFGVVLYEMLTGQPAFQGDSTIAIMGAILHKEPAALDAPPALKNIVTRCLSKSPADRFQSAGELRAAIESAATVRPPVTQPGDNQPSIAVLPFTNMSGDKDNEYFSDGLAEEIINVLAHIQGLKVIARTSAFAFRGKEQDIRKIAEALGVVTILEGSVRRAGNRIRITAQLIDAEDGSHLWSERYDREMADVFAIQDEIAGAIASALKTKLAVQPAQSGQQHTPILEAYHAVLRARHHMSKVTPGSMVRARECLEQAIAIDPEYALPHSVLGGSFVTPAVYGFLPADQAMPQARAAYRKALEIDPMLPEALVGLAAINMFYDYNWKEAERYFQMAMTRGPLSGGARARYGHYLFLTGRPEAALREHESSVQEDPLNVTLRFMLALALTSSGRGADAIRECRRILELDETFYLAHFNLSLAFLQRGDIEEALAAGEKAYSLAPWAQAIGGYVAGLLKLTGDSGRADSILQKLGDGTAHGASLGFTYYYLICSEIERAADWVEKLIQQREPMLLFLLIFPLGKNLRRSSRWPELAKMINLS
jgi:eukaryotic-like serine/threonine-protein kinase